MIKEVLAPMGSQQELWTCGVTYLRSMVGRQDESKAAGGANFMVKYMKQKERKFFLKPLQIVLLGIEIK